MKEARKQRRLQRSGGGWSPQRFPRVWTGSGWRSRPTRRAHLGGRGRQAAERGGERGRGRPRGRGGCPRPRGRGHGRGGGRGTARTGALLPSRLPADRGTAGTQRPDLSLGRVPGRRADAPRPRLLLGAYRAQVPHAAAAAAAASPGRTTTTPFPRPPAPPPARLRRSPAACARRAGGYLGLAGPRPRLQEPEEPEECMAGGGAGGRRRRRGLAPLRLRRGPRASPAARRLDPQGPAAFAGAGGEGGGREEAAGVGTAAEPPPERPLMKARPPPPGPLSPPPPASPTPLVGAGQGPWGCLDPRPGRRDRAAQKDLGMSTNPYTTRGALWSKLRAPFQPKQPFFIVRALLSLTSRSLSKLGSCLLEH